MGTQVDGGTQTQRQVIESVAKQHGRDLDEMLKIPECPPEMRYLLSWFEELNMACTTLSYSEIEAWARLTRKFPTPDEVAVLVRLNRELLLTMQGSKTIV